MKIERSVLTFANLILLSLACSNVCAFLVKRGMYKSFPLVMIYFIIVAASALSVVYELYMATACG